MKDCILHPSVIVYFQMIKLSAFRVIIVNKTYSFSGGDFEIVIDTEARLDAVHDERL